MGVLLSPDHLLGWESHPLRPSVISDRTVHRPLVVLFYFPVEQVAPLQPTPRCPRIDAISWSACAAIRPVVPCPWSARRKTPTAISCTPSPTYGPMAPRAFASHRWNSWRSWRPSCPCPACIWCAMGLPAAQPPAWGHRPDAPPVRMADEEHDTASPRWSWARLLKRVFALDMARCSFCQQGTLRIIAAITQGAVIRKILQHLKLSADPPSGPGACPPGNLRLVLSLSAAVVSCSAGVSSPRVGGGAWLPCVPAPPARLAAARVPHPLLWQRAPRPPACAPVSAAALRCASSVTSALYQSLQAYRVESVSPAGPAADSLR